MAPGVPKAARFIGISALAVALAIPAFLQAATASAWPVHGAFLSLGGIFNGEETARAVRAQLLATGVMQDEKAPLPAPARAALLSSVRREPLNPRAHSLLTVDRKRAGDEAGYAKLVNAVLQLKKRSPDLNYLALDLAVANRDLERATASLERMMIVRPSTREEILPLLLRFVDGSRGSAAVALLLRDEPDWASSFFSAAAKDRENLLNLADLRVQMGRRNVSTPAIDRDLIRNVAKRGDFATAWSIYRLRTASHPDSVLSWSDLYPPFDWSLTTSPDQFAELEASRRSITIDVERGSSGVAASQVVPLSPGRWRLSGTVERSGSGSHSLSVTLRCASSETDSQVLATLEQGSFSRDFTVPANGCLYRELDFATRGDLSSTPSHFAIESVSFEKVS